ncbi:Putative protein AIG2 [Septoria linicola]|uniref:Uncharacterized protein n=1 Tax=Septoria linicola TaxID=215465 RepID=A0A9Q9EHY2_9PEZI|nr:putative protein AIG2 [Septoria linicola]USW50447.1 Putative protein AIG2 [Septoria linicola]
MSSWSSGQSHQVASSSTQAPPPTTTARSKLETLSESNQWPAVGTYFFFGPLRGANTLREVLQLAEEPVLKPAIVNGFVLKRWSMYPVMLWSMPESTVRGDAFFVRSTEDAERLLSYAKRARSLPKRCKIFLDGRSEAVDDGLEGYTFLFRGGSRNQDDLADWKNGDFDLNTDLDTLKRWEGAKAAAGQSL